MAWGIAMITDICRQPGDRAGFRRNLDAACGLGAVFVQSTRFTKQHRRMNLTDCSSFSRSVGGWLETIL